MVKSLQKYTKEQPKNTAVFNENYASKQQYFFIKFSLKISLKIIPNLHQKLRQNSTNFCLKFTAHSVRILIKNVVKKNAKKWQQFYTQIHINFRQIFSTKYHHFFYKILLKITTGFDRK